MVFYYLFSIIVTAALGYGIYRAWKDLRQVTPPDKGIIHIIVDNAPVRKNKATDRNTVIHEAEAMFATLQRKYLYSPLPFKVMGEFYANKGIYDKAIEKYKQMLRYLNDELDMNKLEPTITFLREQGESNIAEQILNHYKESR